MMLAAVSEPVWLALIAAGVVLIPIAFTKWEARETRKVAERIAKEAREDARMARSAEILAAKKIKEVKEALEEKGESTDVKLEVIHKLVNSALGVQLKRVMLLSREKADLSKDAGHIAEADADQLAYENHMRDQPAGT